MNLSPAELQALQAALPSMGVQEKLATLEMLEQMEAQMRVQSARNDLLEFAHEVYPNYSAGGHHRRMAALFRDVLEGKKTRVIINIAPRHGKLLADDTPMLTANRGWVTHGELRIGDRVFSPSGMQTTVVAVSEPGPADVRMEFFDGSVLYCHENHEWALLQGGVVKVREAGTFLRNGLTRSYQKQVTCKGRAMYGLPTVSPLQFESKTLEVHPYVLGAWLGDGSAGKPCVTHAEEDMPYVDKIEALGYKRSTVCVHNTTGVLTTYFSGPKPNVAGELTKGLQALGVYENKHIPDVYLQASVEQRMGLLAGLIDTDGSMDKTGRYRFVSCNKALVDGVVELVKSMGWRASVTRAEPVLSTSGIQGKRPYWTVAFNATCAIPVVLERKKFKRAPVKRLIGLRSVVRDACGKTGRCIQVDAPDGLYLAGRNLTPTHNSELTSYLLPAWFLGHRPDAKIIMATHTQALSEDFGRRVRNLIADPDYQRIFPETSLQTDSKSAGSWNTRQGGKYYAVGVGGALAGRGADLLVIDDPHALPLDTEVPTPDGFKTIAQLRVGDSVFGPDGLPTKVVAKSDVWADRELYRVTTDDGEVVYCDAGHLWAYRSDTNLRKGKVKVAPARDLEHWAKKSRPCLPRHAAVQYSERKLPVDPYVFGAWLGDGTSSLGRMTAHPDDAPFMRAQFEAAGYTVTDQADEFCFGVLGLRAQLIEMGVLNNKHIPQEYMESSVEQRMALLQGLMDTDGTVTTAGECSFQNTNKALAEGVRTLLHSLGVKAKLCAYHDARGAYKTRKVDYRVNFKLQDAARMPRKRVRTYTPTDKRCRSITVERTSERADVQCITVEREDGLFLVGRGYVVTHNSEQDIKTGTRLPFDTAWNWYQTGPRQRLMWEGAVIVVMTRWSTFDLTARLLDYGAKNPDADQWEVVEFPAILPSGKSLWPEKWSLESLLRTKASLDPKYWTAQYMQDPSSDEAAIIARSDWRIWEKDSPPRCNYIIQALDAAAETTNRSDFTSLTTWGVFVNEAERDEHQLILLDRVNQRMQFPELKEKAVEQFKRWEPDAFIVEKKSSGTALYQEMRFMGLPVQEYTPHRGSGDKVARLNAVADIVKSGKVWIPDTWWAREMIDQIAQFPSGEHDDDVDTTSMALMRFRQGGYLTLQTDDMLSDKTPFYGRRAAYY